MLLINVRQVCVRHSSGTTLIVYKGRNRNWQRMIVRTIDPNDAVQEVVRLHASMYETDDIQVRWSGIAKKEHAEFAELY